MNHCQYRSSSRSGKDTTGSVTAGLISRLSVYCGYVPPRTVATQFEPECALGGPAVGTPTSQTPVSAYQSPQPSSKLSGLWNCGTPRQISMSSRYQPRSV